MPARWSGCKVFQTCWHHRDHRGEFIPEAMRATASAQCDTARIIALRPKRQAPRAPEGDTDCQARIINHVYSGGIMCPRQVPEPCDERRKILNRRV